MAVVEVLRVPATRKRIPSKDLGISRERFMFWPGRDRRPYGSSFGWPRSTPAGTPRECPFRRSAGARHSSRSPRAGFLSRRYRPPRCDPTDEGHQFEAFPAALGDPSPKRNVVAGSRPRYSSTPGVRSRAAVRSPRPSRPRESGPPSSGYSFLSCSRSRRSTSTLARRTGRGER
jgi:hypothetical protein